MHLRKHFWFSVKYFWSKGEEVGFQTQVDFAQNSTPLRQIRELREIPRNGIPIRNLRRRRVHNNYENYNASV